MENKAKDHLITDPILASDLIAAGHEVAAVPNPFEEGLRAWRVTLTTEVAQIIAARYIQRGRTVPRVIRTAAEEVQG